MSALAMLQAYGSDDSEEEFHGFDLIGGSGDRFSVTRRRCGINVDRFSADPADRSDDSDGSFFGTPRAEKPRKKTKKETKKEDSAKKRRAAHAIILKDCGCRKRCVELLSHDDRQKANEMYWNQDANGQRSFVQNYVSFAYVQNRRKNRNAEKDLLKKRSYICTLPTANDVPVAVCRTFFLNTIGFGAHCGNIIYRSVTGCEEDEPHLTKRGRYSRKRDTREAIKAHIMTFGPSISHYRREHAPNRLYLPSDLTQRSMHEQYQATHATKASYPVYSRVINELKISFVKLGHEECEMCVAAEEHKKTSGHESGNSETIAECTQCFKQHNHLEYAKLARAEYRADGDTAVAGHLVMAVDLQKVIQLPRFDGLKSVVFSQRILTYNETFAPVGAYTRTFPVVACLWPEQISGRSSNDVLSCFHRVIQHYGHLDTLTLWLDNCSSQNKHWNFFQHIVLLLNKTDITLKKVVLKYFEPGHTFMSADSFHAAVETAMRHERVVTFDDFKSAVAKATRKVDVLDMKASNFFQTKLTVTQYTLNQTHPRPYIDNIRKMQFEKGRYEVGYTDSVDGKLLVYCTLFSKKQQKLIADKNFKLDQYLSWQTTPRGIDEERKLALLSTLHAVVPENKKAFFEDLPTKKGVVTE